MAVALRTLSPGILAPLDGGARKNCGNVQGSAAREPLGRPDAFASAANFAELQACLINATAKTVILSVETGDELATARFVERSLTLAGRQVVRATTCSPWHDLLSQMGLLGPLGIGDAGRIDAVGASKLGANEPHGIGALLAQRLAALGLVLVLPAPRINSWSARVLEQVVATNQVFVVVVGEASAPPTLRALAAAEDGLGFDFAGVEVQRLSLKSRLTDACRSMWFESLAADAAVPRAANLRELESLFQRSVHAAQSRAPLSVHAERIYQLLGIASVPLTLENVAVLVGVGARESELTDALAELRAAGLCDSSISGAVVALRSPSLSLSELVATDPALTHAVALVLEGASADPWSLLRAATLRLELDTSKELAATEPAHEGSSAEALLDRALDATHDAALARELLAHFHEGLSHVSAPSSAIRLHAADRALQGGDAEDALRFLRALGSLDTCTMQDSELEARAAVLWARAFAGTGDLASARVALEKARSLVRSDSELAVVAVEEAELHYLLGRHAEAGEAASEAIAACERSSTYALSTDVLRGGANAFTLEVPASVRPGRSESAGYALHRSAERQSHLRARNTLGKVLLAEGRFEDAEQHFAADAWRASRSGDAISELRATLNRAIAVLSLGRLEDARRMFQEVLAESSKHPRSPVGLYALANLAVVAIRRHEYGEALDTYERTLSEWRKNQTNFGIVRALANLAALRIRFGLVDHADQTLAFARRIMQEQRTPWLMAKVGVEMAEVALCRNRTELARRYVNDALADAEVSNDKTKRAEARLLSTRIALEDGDVAHAIREFAIALPLATEVLTKSQAALLSVQIARASGTPLCAEAVREAIAVTLAAGDEESARELHVIAGHDHVREGRSAEAQFHLGRALALRDQVAHTLPADVRAAYLSKPAFLALHRLAGLLDAKIESSTDEESPRTVRSPASLEAVLAPKGVKHELLGDDPQVVLLRRAIAKVAKSNSTVLIQGESGTGKELVAAALHQQSDFSEGPLVTVNCAALVETLLLSELFGHEKGAFTGASGRRRGRFELADGGTLFLDEIGDISAATQVALLRVLQEKTFERVGGIAPIRTTARVVCATHRDLRSMVERGEFREDLYYRLRGITLEVPALRQRKSDLGLIAESLLKRIAAERNEEPKRLLPETLELLRRHRWPGNIRELENVLRTATLFADGESISAADILTNIQDFAALPPAPSPMGEPSQKRLPYPPAGFTPAPGSLASLASAVLAPAALYDAARTSGSFFPPTPTSSAFALALDDANDVSDESFGEDSTAARHTVDEVGLVEGPLPDGEAGATRIAYEQIRRGVVSLTDMKRQIERDCIARALEETRGNITKAAILLGMKRPRLSQLVKQYGLAAEVS